MTHPPVDAGADPDVVEFARLGWITSLEWTVETRDWATFAAVMAAIPGCNNFDPAAIAATFKPLFGEAMRVRHGREASAVMYVEVPFYPGQRIGSDAGMGERYSDEQRHDYTQRVIAWGRSMLVDTVTVRQLCAAGSKNQFVVGEPGEKPYEIRLWWD